MYHFQISSAVSPEYPELTSEDLKASSFLLLPNSAKPSLTLMNDFRNKCSESRIRLVDAHNTDTKHKEREWDYSSPQIPIIKAIMPMIVWNLPNHIATFSKLPPIAGPARAITSAATSWSAGAVWPQGRVCCEPGRFKTLISSPTK